jgi:hypothetical protein
MNICVLVCQFPSAFELFNCFSRSMVQTSFTDDPLHLYIMLFSHINNITMMAVQVSEDEVPSLCNVSTGQDVCHE